MVLRRSLLTGLFGVLILFVATLWPARFAAAEPDGNGPVLTVFVRDGCPHCADAKAYLAGLARERPALRIDYRAIDRDPQARHALEQVSRQAGIWPPGVPTFVVGERVMIGFGDAADSGPELLALLDAAPPAASALKALPAPRQAIDAPLFGTLSVAQLGLPLFTLAIGLLDGFNPCATWVLLFLLSLLVRLHDRRRMALIAGTFVLVSGAVYYALMAAWLNLFLAVGLSAPLRVGLALLAIAIGAINTKDYFVWGRGVSLSIPEKAKPGLFERMRRVMNAPSLPAAMAGVALLAIAVNLIELLCTAGLPAIYTAILTQQGLGHLAYHGYLGLYIIGYITDDALMVTLAVSALASSKLTEQGGRWLKLLSGLVMLALGLVMLLRPQWLG
ncbi:MAG: glutaredoxin family protein [Betaproteobacteria bacterium]|nr:glutaredoxin family protein [Betaproteobacteria bacterium]